MIEEKHVKEALKFDTLGPSYFSAQELCENFFKEWEPDHLNDIALKVSETVSEKIFDDLRDFIWDGQLEGSLQSEAYNMVDDTVKALLTGQEWAIKKYVLNDRHGDGKVVRETIARLIPEELQLKRVNDLVKELEEVKTERDYWRNRSER